MKCAVSEQVHNHFRKYEVEYLQFAFRWMNNLLMRELPLRCTIRLWDTYQVQGLPLPSLLYWSLWGQFHRTFIATWVMGGPVGRGFLGSSSGAAGADPEFCYLQSEPEGFSHFHLYVCAAFLIKWRKEILDEEDFQVSPWAWG